VNQQIYRNLAVWVVLLVMLVVLVTMLRQGHPTPSELSFSDLEARVEAGEEVPCCRGCGQPLKPDAVFFGQPVPPDRLARSVEGAEGAEVFLVVGSSLSVRPAAALPERALLRGGRLIIVNEGPTRLDSKAHAVLRGRAGDILPALVEAALG